MGFRLSSAIAGFATRTSENLDELQTKADDIAKTAAARYANEALQVRKERMKSRQEYLEAATNLKNNYGLSNNQIEVILSGGVANKDLFIERMKDIEDEAYSSAKASGQDMSTYKFDNVAALGRIFTGEAQGDGRAIMEQAKLFASKRSPFASPDMQSLGDSISKSTKTLFGSISPEYGMQQFEAQVKAQAGELPTAYDATTGFGDTGLTARLQGLSMQEKRAIETHELTKKTTQLTNEQLEKNNAWISLLKEAELEKLNLGNELFEVQIENAELQNTNLGYKNSMLNDQLTDWRDWGQDLNKSTKEAELNKIMTDILYSKDTSPAQVLGGLLKERQRIESGALDKSFQTPEDKKAAIEQLTTQITRTQAIMTTMYEAQQSSGQDLTGIRTMSAYHESFKLDAYEEVGIKKIPGTETLVLFKDGNQFESGSKEYKNAKKQAEKIAGDKFKFMFVPEGVAMNDAAASIARGIDTEVETVDKTNKVLEKVSQLPIEETITLGVNADDFLNTPEGKVKLLQRLKKIYADTSVEMPSNEDLAKMINDAVVEGTTKSNNETENLLNLFSDKTVDESEVTEQKTFSREQMEAGEFFNLATNVIGKLNKNNKSIVNKYINPKTPEEREQAKEELLKIMQKTSSAGGPINLFAEPLTLDQAKSILPYLFLDKKK